MKTPLAVKELRMKQEKISPTWRRSYATHIFAKFLDFGPKILPVIYFNWSWILPNEK